ncbi:MAG: hypothetical protein HZA95_00865 [Candidatus Vogelbacteria bacterium]|nr:hypothetical protein [Candidatus Vogelbacteria bacterium]
MIEGEKYVQVVAFRMQNGVFLNREARIHVAVERGHPDPGYCWDMIRSATGLDERVRRFFLENIDRFHLTEVSWNAGLFAQLWYGDSVEQARRHMIEWRKNCR